jgi:tRNA threonylcarbamoyl adenosine modification protein (Sua5/YciO/YrdC/YwlC family)
VKRLGSAKDVDKFARYFDYESVVVFPTDTVVGLGCRFDSAQGIARIRQIKGIVDKNPLAVLVADDKQVDFLKVRRSHIANLLMEKFWPGGLTIVMSAELVYPCSGEGNSLGLRMPDTDFLRRIIDRVGVPLAATSANFHGQSAPAKLANVDKEMAKMANHIIDFEIRPSGNASTVVKIEGGHLKIIREGAISRQEILDIAGGR